MSAIADFTVAVLDCHACYGYFIENRVAVAMHADRIACPHCGAHYERDEDRDDAAGEAFRESAAQRHGRSYARHPLHLAGNRRRKLQ
jgi:hydrogenase maturation factor HypF (carbamoyltransferase family)